MTPDEIQKSLKEFSAKDFEQLHDELSIITQRLNNLIEQFNQLVSRVNDLEAEFDEKVNLR